MTAQKLPILTISNFFLFPKQEGFLTIEDNQNKKDFLHQVWQKSNGYLLIIPELNITPKSKIKTAEYSGRGTLAQIVLNLSATTSPEEAINSSQEVRVRGLERIRLVDVAKSKGILWGEYEILFEKRLSENKLEELKEKFVRHIPEVVGKVKIPQSKLTLGVIETQKDISSFIDLVTHNSKEIDDLTKWGILVSENPEERWELLVNFPDKRKIDKDLEGQIRTRLHNQYQKYYLQEKLRAIKKQLADLEGGSKGTKSGAKNEIQKYLERLESEPYPERVKKIVQEEIDRYEMMPAYSSEASIIRQYVDWLMNLPWGKRSLERSDLDFARRKLDENHYGLMDIKERIIEYLAVRKKLKESGQKEQKKSVVQIMCFVGPPGIGKTSLARSIAEALGLKFAHISVAGMRDVAEIKGHRRTYIGAMPGRIIQSVKKVGVENFVFLIDEIDKVSYDHRADPIDALLEVLDPNQNFEFTDDYLGSDVPFDLSKIIFICTANSTWNLPRPLLDRLEIIRLHSYTEIEKFHIGKEHLIPENIEKYGLASQEIKFQDEAIKEIIKYYTRETGVRELNRRIQAVIRKFVLQMVEKKKTSVNITPKNLPDYLKKKNYEHTRKQKQAQIGVATGLVWTEVGGDILLIEASCSPGKGELILTGNLGDIMKESAQVALAYVKANHQKCSIDSNIFTKNDIHIHVLEGATPKEGPSAGIALTSAIISVLTGQTIPADIGMTGEITLHGRLEAIGGLKEKAIAAHRSELKKIIIPKANEKDIADIPEEVRQDLKIILAESYDEAAKQLFISKKILPKKGKMGINALEKLDYQPVNQKND